MPYSPMMQQYIKTKEQYPDCILLYRLGDFYEMFFDDALICSKILDLVLTGRDCGNKERAPMCGIPYHALDNYLPKLISAGKKVAICEQLSPAGKQIVTRDVVRVVTPGTITEESILDEKNNNFLGSVYFDGKKIAFSWCDITTGQVFSTLFSGENIIIDLQNFLASINPSEIIANSTAIGLQEKMPIVLSGAITKFNQYYDKRFTAECGSELICSLYKINSIKVFEASNYSQCVASLGGLFSYINDTQKKHLSHFEPITFISNNNFISIDYNTRRNLELTENSKDRKNKGSLLWLIDKTATGSGARMLRNWVSHPLTDKNQIEYRLDAVENLIDDFLLREGLFDELKKVKDIERLAGKLSCGLFTPYDCNLLRISLCIIPKIKEGLRYSHAQYLVDLNNEINPLVDLTSFISSTIRLEATKQVKDSNFIKEGYNSQLDEFREKAFNSKKLIEELEIKEREETDIRTLKVGYNKAFGLYFEVSNSFKSKVPEHYTRKQTLVNGERYITDQLKQLEVEMLSAEENFNKLEKELYIEILTVISKYIKELQKTANALAQLDALLSLSKIAVSNGYIRPTLTNPATPLIIKGGRHPIVEEYLKYDNFISNDTLIDNKANRTIVLTGPNMAGKSTYMRQIALITVMAHIGSFVPATSATIPITDKIFTRVGASDDLAFNQSTFMVEMVESAYIINNATKNSLIILDELGRGTSTLDGVCIAQAVLEYINNNIQAKTIFATHFHELNKLESENVGICNYRVAVEERNDKVIFLRKIEKGSADKSFGIEVAEIAGINQYITQRAKELSKIKVNNYDK